MGRGAKVVFKRGGGGSGVRGARGRFAGGGDTDDDEYVVGEEDEEEEEEEDVSEDSYSSDASLEVGSCSEEEEEEDDEYDWLDEEDVEAGGGSRRTKGAPRLTRKPAAKPLRGERSSVTDEDGEMEDPPIGKPRATRRRWPEVFAEEEEAEADDEVEVEEEDDVDFAPDEDDDEDEELTTALVRKSSRKRSRPAKRQQRRSTKPRKALVAGKRKEKALGRRRRRRTAQGSDDGDFIAKDAVSADGAERKRKRRRRRRWLSSSPDPWDSSASDVDYTMSEGESRDPQVGGASRHRARIHLLPGGVQGGEKGKGKEEVDDVGKRVCGICLSEEHNRVIRGLLDCCTHYFCFACIMEWSKVESKCPVCKRRFTTVSKSARSDAGFGLRTAVTRIPTRDQVYQPSEEELRGYLDPYANVVCLECQQGGDDNLMLLCDICDSSAHTYCVGLGREVPEGNWYCDGCRYTDPGSSNLRVQDSALEHGTSHSDILHEECFGGVNILGNISPAITQHSSSLPSQAPTSQGTALDNFIRRQTLSGDHGTTSYVSGFASSTLSGRRSIQQRIRIILSNNRVRTIPLVARNNVVQPSSLGSYLCDFESQHNGDLHRVPEESLTNRVNERKSTSFPGTRIGMNSHIPNEGNSCCSSEVAKKQIKSTVKRHLNHLTRDSSLGRRDLKEIAGHATHTILAACGLQHRQSKVATTVQVPSGCVHLTDGDLTSLVVQGCCSSCFNSFVENVVQEILNSKVRSA